MPLRLRVILFSLLTLALGACSIRNYQGADDQLYIGIRKIEVPDRPQHPYAEQAIAAAEERLNYAPNGSIFGSSSMRFPLPLLSPAIYMHFAADSSLTGWIARRFTSKPVWMRDVSPHLRAKVAQQTLREQGYLRATAKATIIPATADSMQARVDYQMQLGPLYLLDSVQYFPRVYIRPGR